MIVSMDEIQRRIATGWRVGYAGPGTIYEADENAFVVYNDKLQIAEIRSQDIARRLYKERAGVR